MLLEVKIIVDASSVGLLSLFVVRCHDGSGTHSYGGSSSIHRSCESMAAINGTQPCEADFLGTDLNQFRPKYRHRLLAPTVSECVAGMC
jgi:hypothetical protein